MLDTYELEKVIRQQGYTKKQIAEHLGLSEQGLLNKMQRKSEFKSSEISMLIDKLSIPTDRVVAIFFNQDVN